MQAEAAINLHLRGFPSQKEDNPSGGGLAAQNATGVQVQKPVFAKHKRPGLQLQAKAPLAAESVPSLAKVQHPLKLLARTEQ
jgi:hypothetical protein